MCGGRRKGEGEMDKILNKVKEVREEKDFTEVNNLLSDGWKLLGVFSNDREIIFVLGNVKKA